MLPKLEKLILLGLTDEQIAEQFEVKRQTLYNWKTKIPKVAACFAKNRLLAQGEVAQSLHKRANGFRVKTEKIFHTADTGVVRAKTTEYYPPDVKAAELILRCRQPALWPASNSSVNVGVQLIAGIPNETVEALAKLAQRASEQGSQRTIGDAVVSPDGPSAPESKEANGEWKVGK